MSKINIIKMEIKWMKKLLSLFFSLVNCEFVSQSQTNWLCFANIRLKKSILPHQYPEWTNIIMNTTPTLNSSSSSWLNESLILLVKMGFNCIKFNCREEEFWMLNDQRCYWCPFIIKPISNWFQLIHIIIT